MIAGTKCRDESGHVGLPLQTPEALDGFEHARRDPAQHHLPATPALYIPLHVSGATQQTLGGIGRPQRSLEARREVEAEDRQRLGEPFVDAAGGTRMLVVEVLREVGEQSAGDLDVGRQIRPSDDGLHPRPLPLRQVVEDVPQFMDLTALDEGGLAEDRAGGLV